LSLCAKRFSQAVVRGIQLTPGLIFLNVGIVSGIALGGFSKLTLSFGPTDMHFINPTMGDYWTAAIMLILPQIPLTIGNACVGTADTCTSLFMGNFSYKKNEDQNLICAGREGVFNRMQV
jgi:hypothetical protein